MEGADSVYDRNAPGQAGYSYVSSSGYASNEERLVSESLQRNTMPAEMIRAATQPRNLFPPRFGYSQAEIGIVDVVQVDRRYPDSSAEFSGSSGGYASSTAPSLGWW